MERTISINNNSNINTNNTREKIVLDNGLRVILEKVDFFETVSIGFWIHVGSKDETLETNGYSHLIEHMLFKGTENSNAIEMAREIDRVGGYINAFTTREYTCYYVNMVSKYFDIGINVVADMLLNSLFDKNELEREKQVVIEEIFMYDDTPDQLVHDLFISNIWQKHSIGMPIMGTIDTINNVNRKKLVNFFEEKYFAENIIVSIAGNFDRDKVLNMLNKLPFPRKKVVKPELEKAQIVLEKGYKEKRIEQIYFCQGYRGLSNRDKDRYKLFVFSTLFGGGTSSRLYQEIRENLGLCYAIYTFNSSFSIGGVFGIFSATNPKNFTRLYETLEKQIKSVKDYTITEEELFIAKEQIKGSIIFSKENLEARMNRNAKNELIFGREVTYQEAIENIEAVTVKDMNDIAAYLFESGDKAFFSVGPEGHKQLLEQIGF